MLLVLLVWIIVIFIATVFISQYIKMYQREDVAIAFYILFITMSQILAAKIGDFSIGSFQITAPVAVLIFPFTFQITDMVNENFGQRKTSQAGQQVLYGFCARREGHGFRNGNRTGPGQI